MMKTEIKTLKFRYFTGIRRHVFQNAILVGSWNRSGEYSEWWSEFPMLKTHGNYDCLVFEASIDFKIDSHNPTYRWGVILIGLSGENQWGIPSEIKDLFSQACYCTFQIQDNRSQIQDIDYYLTYNHRLGARKYFPQVSNESNLSPGIVFSVWAPNAQAVELVFGKQSSGYIADDGNGIDNTHGTILLNRNPNGIWSTDPLDPRFKRFEDFLFLPYMYYITTEEGKKRYRTDLYSYAQIGKGDYDPKGAHFTKTPKELDGTKSCSVVCDIERINPHFHSDIHDIQKLIPESDFWRDEYQKDNPMPRRIEDLIIYEMHIAALGAGGAHPGHFEDAMVLLPYLKELGINAIELLPIMEYEGAANWGYGTSHFFAVESSAGGQDQLRYFIRECHRQGIAVIVDVVYNHYHHRAERAELHYDSDNPAHDIYYWYEGDPKTYPHPDYGYIDNMSTGFAPRYYEENVRKMFISSAVLLIENYHVDGFRVDQTTSIHAYNVLHGNGAPMSHINIFGAKFLRELTRTLKIIKPNIILMAEDHSDWSKVTESPIQGGLGFDVTWFANFYHSLIGGQGFGTDYPRLLRNAGFGDERELAIDFFAEILLKSRDKTVVYHMSHDEAGNSENSHRLIEIAINHAPLTGITKFFAESRCKVVAAMTLFSAGIPMFFMGEEVGARKDYTYFTFMQNREDLLMKRSEEGGHLFVFYQDLIYFRLSNSAIRSHNLEILHIHNQNRVLIFRRWDDRGEFIIVMSLNNKPFINGYIVNHTYLTEGLWHEVLNSDAKYYGGNNVGNGGALIPSGNGRMELILPANSVLVLRKQM